MKIHKPIYWHQGMFLQPQHFQLADLHTQFQIKPFLNSGLQDFWGVGALTISESALGNQLLNILSAELIFQDQSYVIWPGNTILKPRSFASAWLDQSRPFNVYLGLKKQDTIESNVAVVPQLEDGADRNVRCVTTQQGNKHADLYSDGPEAEIQSLHYVLQVLWENEVEQLTDYNILPIARLERKGELIQQSRHFIPPCYIMGGSEPLMRVVRDVRDDLAGRARQLEAYKSPREIRKAEFDASFLMFLLALRTLNRYVPLLYQLTESPLVHPRKVYDVLRQIVGELSTFSENCDMLGSTDENSPGLPPYRHQDLAPGLLTVRDLIIRLLNEISIGPDFLITLEPSGEYLTAQLPNSLLEERNRFYLIVRSDMAPDTLQDSFRARARLAEASAMPLLIQRALPGITLTPLSSVPEGLPRRSCSFYFKIDSQSEAWRQAAQSCHIAFSWFDAPDDVKVELVGVNR
ncbi:type VI secretion system baseplate subunit TssK [Edwardsiella ictaluri]|uniref:Type VI secretion protein, VC_A0114 family n=2 Tax=Edwardsiella ictaluri TaxID=67780 RepID=C5BAE7_EDWI9|nr:type VI secretion system baseplate subunit TssK [Edwardsiella ictaluri]ACR69917.1 type VI secretion protein, VC_A0114 family [Edwardsiella ictaluri 93-146]AVZ83150.1 type VI secretion system baseplate subunit TssK [Edwardsiella ictaluri]EKS7764227.1 type VI secretion system baseplate subunit TssK [Edwardsiella ictaluri]EKS7771086.1 type VI secretion system baseplate subunit TssK [Edwardsiella ictaluri]EKS7774178.1 type VI secretion system baseplate subunit TssK [Edwardsiella ictaluri]